MMMLSYRIFHRRRRKIMALIPLKARAGIAALTFAAAMAPFVLATPAIAVTISVNGTSTGTINNGVVAFTTSGVLPDTGDNSASDTFAAFPPSLPPPNPAWNIIVTIWKSTIKLSPESLLPPKLDVFDVSGGNFIQHRLFTDFRG